jgi:hypothetical protein
MNVRPLYGTGPQPLLLAGSSAAHRKINVSGRTNGQNYCEIFIACTEFTNVAADNVLETHGLEYNLSNNNFKDGSGILEYSYVKQRK